MAWATYVNRDVQYYTNVTLYIYIIYMYIYMLRHPMQKLAGKPEA